MASTKVVIAQADYQHLLSTVKLLAGDSQDTEETVGYVFSLLEELGIVVDDAKSGIDNRYAEHIVDNPADASFPADSFKDNTWPGEHYNELLMGALPDSYRPIQIDISSITTNFCKGYEYTGNYILTPEVDASNEIKICTKSLPGFIADLPFTIGSNDPEVAKRIIALEKYAETMVTIAQERTASFNRLLAACPTVTKRGIQDTSVTPKPTMGYHEAEIEDPAVTTETILLLLNAYPNLTKLILHPNTPYKTVKAIKELTKIECVINDRLMSTVDLTNLHQQSVDDDTKESDDVASNPLIEYAAHLEELFKSGSYAFNERARALLIYLNNKADVILLLSKFRTQIDLCVITEEISAEDLSDIQLRFAEVKVCCLNGIK